MEKQGPGKFNVNGESMFRQRAAEELLLIGRNPGSWSAQASEDGLILGSSTVLMVGFLFWPRMLTGLFSYFK